MHRVTQNTQIFFEMLTFIELEIKHGKITQSELEI